MNARRDLIIRGPPQSTIDDNHANMPNAIILYRSGEYLLAFDRSARTLAKATGYPLQENRYIVIPFSWFDDNRSYVLATVGQTILTIPI